MDGEGKIVSTDERAAARARDDLGGTRRRGPGEDEPRGAARRGARVVLRDAARVRPRRRRLGARGDARVLRGLVRDRHRHHRHRRSTARVDGRRADRRADPRDRRAREGRRARVSQRARRRRHHARAARPPAADEDGGRRGDEPRRRRATRADCGAAAAGPSAAAAAATRPRAMSRLEKLDRGARALLPRGAGAACRTLRSTTTTARRRRSAGA